MVCSCCQALGGLEVKPVRALVLLGLIPSLYSYLDVWVEARPEDEGSKVTVPGAALPRKAAFEDEFRDLADTVSQTLQATPAPQPKPAPE